MECTSYTSNTAGISKINSAFDISHREQFVTKSYLINSVKEECKEYFPEHVKNLKTLSENCCLIIQLSLWAFKSTEIGSLLFLLNKSST